MKLLKALTALTVVFTLTPLSAADVSVESLEGEFRADDLGGVNYSLALKTPPGINGMKPSLAIHYHSSQAKGLLGTGFDIKGLSKVSRCPTTQSIEGEFDPVDFDGNDAICVDGRKVVPRQGSDNPLRFDPVIENGEKILRHGSGSGDYWFEVWKKSGEVYEYGRSEDSRLVHPSGVISWLLTKIRDRNGNYIQYNYLRPSEQSIPYIASITYTHNDRAQLTSPAAIKFVYKESGQNVRYIQGKAFQDRQLLSSIDVYSGDTFVWQYTFTYDDSIGTSPFLTKIGLCAPSGPCTKPMEFTWSGKSVGDFSRIELADDFYGEGWRSKSTYRLLVDLNSDGYNDIIGMNRDGVFVSYRQQDGFKPPQKVLDDFKYSDTGWVYSRHPMRFSDIDKDGFVDLIGFHTKNVYVAKGVPTGFAKPKAITEEFTIDDGWSRKKSTRQVLDINGDALPDIVGLDGKGVWVAIGNGKDFAAKTRWSSDFSDDQGWKIASRDIIRFVDANGDGKADIFGKKGSDLYLALNAGDKFEPYKIVAQGIFPDPFSGRKLFLSDVNADGNTDVVFTDKKGVKVALGTGTEFEAAKLWGEYFGADQGWSSRTHYRDLIDMNKDGLPDFVGFSAQGFEVSLSDGTSFAPPKVWLDGFKPEGKWQKSRSILSVNDVDGTGTIDILGFNDDGVFISSNAAESPILSQVYDSKGNYLQFIFKPISDPKVYDARRDAKFPEIDYQSAYRVLAEASMGNRQQGPLKTVTYRYSGFKLHSTEFGGLGFASRTVTDSLTGVVTETSYSQDWQNRLQGSVVAKTVFDRAGKKLSAISYNYQPKKHGERRFSSQLVQTTSRQFGEAETEIQVVVSRYRYDEYGNVVETKVNTKDAYSSYEKKSLVSYSANQGDWLISKPLRIEIIESEQGKADRRNVKTMTYDDKGRLSSSTANVGTSSEKLEEFVYNDIGLPVKSTVTWRKNSKNRLAKPAVTTFQYDGNGQLAMATGPAGHSSKTQVSAAFGTSITTTDLNGLKTSYSYDGLGVLVGVIYPDGTQKNIVHGFCAPSSDQCPKGAFRWKSEKVSGSGQQVAYYDSYGRVLKNRSASFGGAFVNEDIVYNSFGMVEKRSLPYFDGEARHWIEYRYDDHLRLVSVTYPNGRAKTFAWADYNVIETDADGQTKEIRKDSLGRIRTIIDSNGTAISHELDASGNITQIAQEGSVQLSFSYDQLNRKIAQWSPNSGQTQFAYTAEGRLEQVQFATGRVERYGYDVLGRKIAAEYRNKDGKGQQWAYTWDKAAYGIGKLASVRNKKDSYSKTYSYDALSRVASEDEFLGGESYVTAREYDQFSQIKKYTYPGGVSIDYSYDDNGFMQAVSRSGQRLWQLKKVNVYGQVAEEQLGNGVIRQIDFDPKTNAINAIKAAAQGTKEVQNYAYSYDVKERLVSTFDGISNKSEVFNYDSLDRLVSYSYGDNYTELKYSSEGNILSKTGVGQYRYVKDSSCPGNDNPFPHAVSSIVGGDEPARFCYDPAGGMISANKRTIAYAANGKIASIADPNAAVALEYGPDTQLIWKSEGRGDQKIVTWYADEGDFEVVQKGAKTSYKYYIGDAISIVRDADSGEERIEYLLRDRLSSVTQVLDDKGKVSHGFIYDPWGLRRDTVSYKPSTGLVATDGTQIRGFTGHRHFAYLPLIDMSARVYDPKIGRFLSADRFYDSQDLQGLNPYSYVNNSPLQYVDPTGFFLQKLIRGVGNALKDGVNSVKDAIKNPAKAYKAGMRTYATLGNVDVLAKNYDKSGRWVKNNEKTIITVAVMAAANTFIPGAGTLYGQMLLGALSSYYNSNGDLKATAVGAISSGMFYGIGSAYSSSANQMYLSDAASKTVAHGMVGGFRSVAMGGNFEEGFSSAAISQISSLSGLYDAFPQDAGSQLVAAAVIGGTTAELTGGSFEDAAIIAVISHSANDLSHAIKVISIGTGPALMEPTLVGEVVLGVSAGIALVGGKYILESGILDDLSIDSSIFYEDAKAPGIPTAAVGFKPKKGWDGKTPVKVPNSNSWGYPAKDKSIWVPTGQHPGLAHGGPHWDVQYPRGGGYKNVYPDGRVRITKGSKGKK